MLDNTHSMYGRRIPTKILEEIEKEEIKKLKEVFCKFNTSIRNIQNAVEKGEYCGENEKLKTRLNELFLKINDALRNEKLSEYNIKNNFYIETIRNKFRPGITNNMENILNFFKGKNPIESGKSSFLFEGLLRLETKLNMLNMLFENKNIRNEELLVEPEYDELIKEYENKKNQAFVNQNSNRSSKNDNSKEKEEDKKEEEKKEEDKKVDIQNNVEQQQIKEAKNKESEKPKTEITKTNKNNNLNISLSDNNKKQENLNESQKKLEINLSKIAIQKEKEQPKENKDNNQDLNKNELELHYFCFFYDFPILEDGTNVYDRYFDYK